LVFGQTGAPGLTAIQGVRVFDGESVLEGRTVLIRDGEIESVSGANARVPQGAVVVPGAGRTLIPGLIDSHVHVSPAWPEEALHQALEFGVTAVVDMWTNPPPPGFTFSLTRFKQLNAANRADLAAVTSAGTGVTAPGGHPTQMEGGAGAAFLPVLSDASGADAFVAARIAEGSDFIKMIVEDTNLVTGGKLPTLNNETIAAVVQAAHARDRLAVAHVRSEQQARGAIGAGVDGLAHIFSGATASEDFGKFVKSKGAFVIPTLTILYAVCGRSDGPAVLNGARVKEHVNAKFTYMLSAPPLEHPLSCEGSTKAVHELAEAGVRLLAGTDSPGMGTTYGASLHWELQHLVEAGLTPRQALASATSIPADIFFKGGRRGRVRPGMRADLVLVEGDPTKQIEDTRRIVQVWNRGVPLVR